MLKITAYADRLVDDLDTVDYIERVKTAERNWIGRSYGAEIDFATTAGDALRVFTTRADTIFGATYMVIAPEHPLVEKWRGRLTNYDEVAAYREQAARKSDFERTEMAKDKTGVRLDGVRGGQPRDGEGDSDLRLRLCADHLRHGRDYGRTRARRRATGILPKSSACPSSRSSPAATLCRRRSPIPRRARWSTAGS